MRPSVDEQLHGTCRILEEVVAPAVADPYARTILAGLIANLRMLSQAIPAARQPGLCPAAGRAGTGLATAAGRGHRPGPGPQRA
jgi:hypothetical protein